MFRGKPVKIELVNVNNTTTFNLPLTSIEGAPALVGADERLVIEEITVTSSAAATIDIFNDINGLGEPGQYNAPGTSTATTGGTIAAATYTLGYTYVLADGTETPLSATANQATTGAASTITITAPSGAGALPAGITGIKVYVTAGGALGTGLVASFSSHTGVITSVAPTPGSTVPHSSTISSGKRVISTSLGINQQLRMKGPHIFRYGTHPKFKSGATSTNYINGYGVILPGRSLP